MWGITASGILFTAPARHPVYCIRHAEYVSQAYCVLHQASCVVLSLSYLLLPCALLEVVDPGEWRGKRQEVPVVANVGEDGGQDQGHAGHAWGGKEGPRGGKGREGEGGEEGEGVGEGVGVGGGGGWKQSSFINDSDYDHWL